MQKGNFVLQLRGTVSKPATLLLSDAQYADRLSSDVPFAEFLQTLCMSKSHLFTGTSLEGIENYLSGIFPQFVSSKPHFALLEVTGQSWALRAEALQRRYNLRTVSYRQEPQQKVILSFCDEVQARLDIKVFPWKSTFKEGLNES